MKSFLTTVAMLLLFENCAFGQALSEDLGPFYSDIGPLLSQARNAGARSMVLKLKWYQDDLRKCFSKQTVTYNFINDSIVKEHINHQDYYGLLKNDLVYVFDITTQKSTYKEIHWHSKDSANCRAETYYDSDNTRYYKCSCKAPDGNYVDSSSTTNNEQDNIIINTWRKNGDTLFEETKHLNKIKVPVETYKSIEIRKMCDDRKSHISYYASYTPKTSNNTDSKGISEVDYTYDQHGLLTKIERYGSYDDNYIWEAKHIMSITYKQ